MKVFWIILVAILFSTAAAYSQTNTLPEAEIQGRALAQKILEQKPTTNFAQSGVLKIRGAKDIATSLSVQVRTHITSGNWETKYHAGQIDPSARIGPSVDLTIIHNDQSNLYRITEFKGNGGEISFEMAPIRELTSDEIVHPFTGSDFWLCDLGLEFFHWPQQKILKKEIHRSCACTVLESTNPNPTTNGYSRVVSWIDTESLGIVEAYAYDFNGKKLKDFYPKDIKKVNGQWQVQTLVMENVQTGSRSRLEFDLKQ